MLHDNNQRYGTITRFFHWLVAVLVLQQFFKFADRINEGEHWLGDTFGPWHVSIGAIMLIITVARLFWRIKQNPQRPINPGIDGVIAKLVHCQRQSNFDPPFGKVKLTHPWGLSVFLLVCHRSDAGGCLSF